MTYCRISAHVITVQDHRNLRAVWRLYSDDPSTVQLISGFRCEAPLTESQRKRLPAALKEKLIVG